MPYVPVPKDLTKVKTKVAFNLTKRQLICFALAAITGVPTYLFGRLVIGKDLAIILMIAIMLPFFMFAMYEKDGQPFEKMLRNMIRVKFLYPAARPYQTRNFYHTLTQYQKNDQVVNNIAENKKAKATGSALGTGKKPVKARKGRRKDGNPRKKQ